MDNGKAVSVIRGGYGCALAFAFLLASDPVQAAVTGHWIATATASIAVTGNITVTGNALIFGNGKRLRLIPVGTRQGVWTPLGAGIGTIYRISPPTDPKLLQGTTLCGWPVTFVVLSQPTDDSLALSVFYGTKGVPQHFGDDSCAAYFYERE
jgi:hypothetical protein